MGRSVSDSGWGKRVGDATSVVCLIADVTTADPSTALASECCLKADVGEKPAESRRGNLSGWC